MAGNYFRLAIFLTFVGIILFVWTPSVESKGGGGRGGGRGFSGGGRSSSSSIRSSGGSKSSSSGRRVSSSSSKISKTFSKKALSPIKISKKITKKLPKRLPSRIQKKISKIVPKDPRGKVKKTLPKSLSSITLSKKVSSKYNKYKGYKSKRKGSAKKFAKKHWKKAAAFGAGAAGTYLGYQGYKKLRDADGLSDSEWNDMMIFRSLGHSNNLKDYDDNGQSEYDESYSFEDWDRNARIDGWVCRADVDCEWIDQNLGCDDREFEIKDIQGDWPWKADLIGRCSCVIGFVFDDNTGSCTTKGFPEYDLDYSPVIATSKDKGYNLVKSGASCKTSTELTSESLLGFPIKKVHECANLCKAKSGCKYFIFGIKWKLGSCYWEKTQQFKIDNGSLKCHGTGESWEGWKDDQYDFYEITGN